jgi:hypothetical protein
VDENNALSSANKAPGVRVAYRLCARAAPCRLNMSFGIRPGTLIAALSCWRFEVKFIALTTQGRSDVQLFFIWFMLRRHVAIMPRRQQPNRQQPRQVRLRRRRCNNNPCVCQWLSFYPEHTAAGTQRCRRRRGSNCRCRLRREQKTSTRCAERPGGDTLQIISLFETNVKRKPDVCA